MFPKFLFGVTEEFYFWCNLLLDCSVAISRWQSEELPLSTEESDSKKRLILCCNINCCCYLWWAFVGLKDKSLFLSFCLLQLQQFVFAFKSAMVIWKLIEKLWCWNGFLGMCSLKLGRRHFRASEWWKLKHLFEHFLALSWFYITYF